MSDTNIVGFIFARGGSKGVPKKNIRSLGGRPLIAYAIDTARQSEWIDRVVVSTDCPEIARIARQHGAEVPFMRPPHLATDSVSERLAWRHAIEEMETQSGRKIDVMVALPTTAPFRTVDDVDACIKLLGESDADIVITASHAQRSPYYNMIVLDDERTASLVIPPSEELVRRQDSPAVYDMTTVAYAANRDYVFASDSIFQGKVKAVIIPPERSVDIDTEFDFQIAEYMIESTAGCNVQPLPRKAG